MKHIVINATAAYISGGLTIVKDFMSYLYSNEFNNKNIKFHLITATKDIFSSNDNVVVYEVPIQKWRSRIKWDYKGVQNWCISRNIIPDLVISFQNTCARFTGEFSNVKQLVYYHQLLPLVKYKWNLFRKEEQKLFLYSFFYGFFVNLWNSNAEYIVQLFYVKNLFCKKFKNISGDVVHVIRPNLPKIEVQSIIPKTIFDGKKVLIYPAASYKYKNHMILLEAVELLYKNNKLQDNNFIILFTVSKSSRVAREIKKRRLENVFYCIDNIPYEELLTYYKRCNALLFPSKIESFGMPLVEAAMFGKPIIASDLPYAKEVLKGYDGALFADVKSSLDWMNKIKTVLECDKVYSFKSYNYDENTWGVFLTYVKKMLENN